MSLGLVKQVYSKFRRLPMNEKFNLIGQMSRSAVSIPSNIVEGSIKELVNFLQISLGSSFKLETQIILSRDLEFPDPISSNEILAELNHLQKKISVFSNTIKERNSN
jgi:four helix bundle protein